MPIRHTMLILETVTTTDTKMKKILIALALMFSTSAYAMDNIDVCNNCRITYQQPVKKVVKTVQVPVAVEYVPAGPGPISSTVMVPVAVPPRPAAPLVPVYNYVPTPEASNIYSPPGYPTNVPVAASGNCAMYVDPYDLFGQLFGGADLVQSCMVPAY